MNRAKKEELKRYHAARKGLTPDEIAALDIREAEEEAIEKEVGQMHLRLFPEEYDFYYDDIFDAKRRAQGINPMASEYIARVNARRSALGFANYMDDCDSRPRDTMGWVRQMMLDGKLDDLEGICQRHREEDAPTDGQEFKA